MCSTDQPQRYLNRAYSEHENLANILKTRFLVNSQFVVTVRKDAFLSKNVNMPKHLK